MADGVGTGIGIGIGQGLGEIGDAIRARRDRQRDDREKQADALHTKGVQIASKLLESGYTTRHDAQAGGPILIDAKTGQLAQDAPPNVGNLFNELVSTSKQATALFPPNEPNAIAQHFRKWLKQPQAEAKPNPRAQQFTPEGMAAEAPTPKTAWARDKEFPFKAQNGIVYEHQINSTTGEERWVPAAGMTPRDLRPQGTEALSDTDYEESQRIKAGLEPKEGAKKPLTFQYHPQTGGLTSITDPNGPETYDASNIANAPPEIKSRWDAIQKQQKDELKRKDDAELTKVKEQEKRDEERFQRQLELQANAYKNAISRADNAEAESIKKTADTRYNNALALDAFANDALKSHDAAKDKLLAGRLIRESEGRFNPAQYDNLTKNAGLGNTFEQWMNNVESGQLTDTMRQSLVNAAHALLASAKTAKDSLVPPATPGDLKDKAKPKSDVDDIIKDLNNLAPAGKH